MEYLIACAVIGALCLRIWFGGSVDKNTGRRTGVFRITWRPGAFAAILAGAVAIWMYSNRELSFIGSRFFIIWLILIFSIYPAFFLYKIVWRMKPMRQGKDGHAVGSIARHSSGPQVSTSLFDDAQFRDEQHLPDLPVFEPAACDLNPATGSRMVPGQMVDYEGNPYGVDNHNDELTRV